MKFALRIAALFALLLAAGMAHAERVVISINKSSQRMIVSVDGERQYVWPVSTGAAGYTTPNGSFHPFRLEEDYYSKKWDDAPMPHSIFFTRSGHAIHGSYHVKNLGHPASHGCVRLAPANAAKLYALVEDVGMRNTTVVVKGGSGQKRAAERYAPRYRRYEWEPPWWDSFDDYNDDYD